MTLFMYILYNLSRRKRTKFADVVHALYLNFNGLSLRNTSKALLRFLKRSHKAIRNVIQKYNPARRLFYKRLKISEFIVDETRIKVGAEYIWSWVAIELESKEIVGLSISKERKICL